MARRQARDARQEASAGQRPGGLACRSKQQCRGASRKEGSRGLPSSPLCWPAAPRPAQLQRAGGQQGNCRIEDAGRPREAGSQNRNQCYRSCPTRASCSHRRKAGCSLDRAVAAMTVLNTPAMARGTASAAPACLHNHTGATHEPSWRQQQRSRGCRDAMHSACSPQLLRPAASCCRPAPPCGRGRGWRVPPPGSPRGRPPGSPSAGSINTQGGQPGQGEEHATKGTARRTQRRPLQAGSHPTQAGGQPSRHAACDLKHV